MEDSESYNQLGFEDRLALLVDSEWNRRRDNKLIRFIRNARFIDIFSCFNNAVKSFIIRIYIFSHMAHATFLLLILYHKF
ncbi:MAG: IstB-like ATP-binding domain-containing protein [Ruminococcus sp.]|nr:IstB-like ATP-binding domain-containing protein [Ruminococcus sp.]